jgi:hypothetical protein
MIAGQVGGVALAGPTQSKLVANQSLGACGAHTPTQLPTPPVPESFPASWQFAGSFVQGSGVPQPANARTRIREEVRIVLTSLFAAKGVWIVRLHGASFTAAVRLAPAGSVDRRIRLLASEWLVVGNVNAPIA